MVREIKLTANAAIELEGILLYLESNWPQTVTNSFLKRFHHKLTLAVAHPEMYPLVRKRSQVRKITLKPHFLIFYRINSDCLEVLSCFDGRQDPRKRPY
jgi:plasmid stabilization system protein ParE